MPMATRKDITEPLLSRSNLPVIIDKFSAKVRSYSIVRHASLRFESIEGARTTDKIFVFHTKGEISVDPIDLPTLRLRFSASGEYKRDEHRVYLGNFKVLNSVAGIANKLIESAGIGIGRSLHVNDHDDELIQELLPNES
jgi:hypothetical protein